jgi:hypothetical protein
MSGMSANGFTDLAKSVQYNEFRVYILLIQYKRQFELEFGVGASQFSLLFLFADTVPKIGHRHVITLRIPAYQFSLVRYSTGSPILALVKDPPCNTIDISY